MGLYIRVVRPFTESPKLSCFAFPINRIGKYLRRQLVTFGIKAHVSGGDDADNVAEMRRRRRRAWEVVKTVLARNVVSHFCTARPGHMTMMIVDLMPAAAVQCVGFTGDRSG